jgi:small basic protein (TIGR04137 family)
MFTMSIDKSLKRKNTLARSRNVLKRAERIEVLKAEERWKDGMSPFGIPKVRVMKVGKKTKKAAKEAPADAAGGDKKAADKKEAKK